MVHWKNGRRPGDRFAQGMAFNIDAQNARRQKQTLKVVCAVLLVICIVLGICLITKDTSGTHTHALIRQRINNAFSAAADEVTHMASGVSSTSASRLGKVRQYIYLADQMNQLSLSMGGEAARFLPDSMISVLYGDIDKLDAQIQASSSSTLDARTELAAHIAAAQKYMSGE